MTRPAGCAVVNATGRASFSTTSAPTAVRSRQLRCTSNRAHPRRRPASTTEITARATSALLTMAGSAGTGLLLDLLRQLRSRGKVTFDPANPTFTSARRLNQGLAYNLVVSCLFYYFLAHSLNRLFGRTMIGTAPAFRSTMRPIALRRRLGRLLAGSVCVALFIAAGLLMAQMAEGR